MPSRCSVSAVVRIMKYIPTLEKNVPAPLSNPQVKTRVRIDTVGARLRAADFVSSTSCDACQKNRYGLIVVPSTPTSIAHPSRVVGSDGTNVAWTTADQSGRTMNAVRI